MVRTAAMRLSFRATGSAASAASLSALAEGIRFVKSEVSLERIRTFNWFSLVSGRRSPRLY